MDTGSLSAALTATQIRDLARRHGFKPSQARGQNFVIDPNTIRRIVRLAALEPGDAVLEVGAGAGSLTVALAAEAERVVAVEIDRRVIAALREVVGGVPTVTIVEGDALALDYAPLLAGRPHRLVANLPYNIATPLITRFLEEVPEVVDLLVMVQREVGQRLVAAPGSKTYGALSVLVAAHASGSVVGRVPASVFWPAPDVDSVLVRLVRHGPVGVPAEQLMRVVHAAFGQRRKMLRNALSAGLGVPVPPVEAALVAAGIDPGARAETLSLEAFVALAQALA
ncbi:MAG TPA: 16S rRNA (adenine(1518)-N(6)/adenine(1519)-N(6))-dimethyltransferase RsmA [Actinomycetota bacterium]|nr:16S rRNA (adenine(1518)-N(6)/adenine(1519)-N(6))-dimethyltransferase RsmA [Actinomycetota bacterium]